MKKLLLILTLSIVSCLTTIQATPKVEQDFLDAVAQGNIKKATIALNYGAYVNAVNDDGYTALHLAAKQYNPQLVKFLLDKGADVDEIAHYGPYNNYSHYDHKDNPKTALQLAAEHGDFLTTYLLLAYGAKDTKDSYGSSSLTARDYAITNGYDDVNALLLFFQKDEYCDRPDDNEAYASVSQDDFKKMLTRLVFDLISHGLDVNIQYPNGKTLLYYVVQEGCVKAFNNLLKHGADITTSTEHGDTLLHVAANHDQVEIASLLIASGADVNATNKHGQTPLHCASKWAPTSSKLVQLLLDHNANVKAEDSLGRTPLMVACENYMEHSDFIKIDEAKRTTIHLEIINLLLKSGASANEQSTKNGLTPLHHLFSVGGYSCSAGCDTIDSSFVDQAFEEANRRVLKVAQILIYNGADVNAQSKEGTPLHKAVYNESHVAFLLSKGADVHQENQYGQTPLHHCSLETTNLLLTYDADINAADNKGNTPLHIAVQEHDRATFGDYHDNIRSCHDKVQLLHDSGANVHQKNFYGATPFHYVATPEIAQLLLDHGAWLHETDNKGNTVLHYAARGYIYYNRETDTYESVLLRFLLDQGCLVNQQNAQGETPLHCATCCYDDGDIKKQCLLKYGADPSIVDNLGNTPQQLAEQKQQNNDTRCDCECSDKDCEY